MFSNNENPNDPALAYTTVAAKIKCHLAEHPFEAADSILKNLNEFECNILLAPYARQKTEAEYDLLEMTDFLSEVLLGLTDLSTLQSPIVNKESYKEPDAIQAITDKTNSLEVRREKQDDENHESWSKEIKILNRKMLCRRLGIYVLGITAIWIVINKTINLPIDNTTKETVKTLLLAIGALLVWYSSSTHQLSICTKAYKQAGVIHSA